MTLYIAILDIHPGDRKQFERLFAREADRRLADSGDVLYVDTFGSREAMLRTPMKYDLFIVDAADATDCPDGAVNLEIAGALRDLKIACPIVLYFEEGIPLPEAGADENLGNIFFIAKPQTKEDVTTFVDAAKEAKDLCLPRLELRDEKQTCYVTADEIIIIRVSGGCVDVVLTKDRTLRIPGKLSSVTKQLAGYDCFLQLGAGVIINMKHAKRPEHRSVIMDNGERIPIGLFDLRRARQCYDLYRRQET